ncbi:phage antirepressor KilAC domain-containing protein [Methylorubrum thiocyanatum]
MFARQGSKRIMTHQTRLNDGYLVHKITVVPDKDGEERAYTQVRFMAKGRARLALTRQARLPGL